jgi:hypothetical protein
MHSEIFFEKEVRADRKLRLFSLYLDFAAAGRARWATSRIAAQAGEPWKCSTEMWNLDSLAAASPLRKMIAQEAADADVLVIAISSLDRRTPELIEWLDSLAACKASRPVSGLFIGLLGDEDQIAGELDWMVKQFLRSAQQSDRDFIWRWMENDAMTDGDWLTESVEALLARKQPGRDVVFLPEAAYGL